jgi:hypothetical protein
MAIATSTDLITHHAHTQSVSDADYAIRHERFGIRVPAEALASDTGSIHCLTGIKPGKLASLKILPSGAVTANNTNYATISVCPYTLATGVVGAAYDAITTEITGTGDWVTGVAEPFTIVPATDVFAATQGIVVTIAKAGAGVALPAYTLEIELTLD